MITIVRTRTLRTLRADLQAASTEAEQRRREAEIVTDSAIRAEIALEELRADLARTIAEAARTEGELETLRAQVFLDTEDRAALRMLLRTAKKTATAPRQVYALLHRGELHSVHESRDAAEKAAESEGAAPGGWVTHGTPGTQTPPREVLWRVQPMPFTAAV
jgi:hypothetical protein